MTPTVPAWISTKRRYAKKPIYFSTQNNFDIICNRITNLYFHIFRVPPASAIAVTTSFLACAVHRNAKDLWHRQRIQVLNGRKELMLQVQVVTPRYRFSEACRPRRPPASTVRHSSTLSEKNTCIPLRWWDEERAASSHRFQMNTEKTQSTIAKVFFNLGKKANHSKGSKINNDIALCDLCAI